MNIFRRIFRCPKPVRPVSFVVDHKHQLTIDMLTAKYNEAVDIMNQQTAALLAACGVLETYSMIPLDKRIDIHEAIADGCLEVCRVAVARAESFPFPNPEILEYLANPEPLPVERHCYPYVMTTCDDAANPPLSSPSPDDEFAAAVASVVSEFKQKSDPRQPPNARLMIALLGREAAASSPLTYIDDRHPSKYDSAPPPLAVHWLDGEAAYEHPIESMSTPKTHPSAVLISLCEYAFKKASEGDEEARRLMSGVDFTRPSFRSQT